MTEHLHKIRRFENLHILLWLLKDTSWMMDWRTLGVIMMFPTIFIAVFIAVKTFTELEFYINLAIFFWICANSYWMCCEFFGYMPYKNYAAIPFILGFISTGYYYLVKLKSIKQQG